MWAFRLDQSKTKKEFHLKYIKPHEAPYFEKVVLRE